MNTAMQMPEPPKSRVIHVGLPLLAALASLGVGYWLEGAIAIGWFGFIAFSGFTWLAIKAARSPRWGPPYTVEEVRAMEREARALRRWTTIAQGQVDATLMNNVDEDRSGCMHRLDCFSIHRITPRKCRDHGYERRTQSVSALSRGTKDYEVGGKDVEGALLEVELSPRYELPGWTSDVHSP